MSEPAGAPADAPLVVPPFPAPPKSHSDPHKLPSDPNKPSSAFSVRMDAPAPSVNEKNDEVGVEMSAKEKSVEPGRAQWSSELKFILSVIGFAVGLGNIWSFPKLVFDHGGGAFIIPYIVCAIFFGLPVLYLEFTIGQYIASAPTETFYKYMPAIQGLGWSMALASTYTNLHYSTMVAWVLLYIVDIVIGRSSLWTRCGNEWNTQFCTSKTMDEDLCGHYEHNRRYWNGSCYTTKQYNKFMKLYEDRAVSPAEEYFERHILSRTDAADMFSFSTFNWPVALALFALWMFTAISVHRSVKSMQRMSYFIFVPFIIIFAMLIGSVTLEGADKGIASYIDTDIDKLFKPDTWKAAVNQMCFSLSIGYGGMMALASYNPKSENVFRDALIVVAADTGMSIFGGFSVFATLGFLANERGVEVKAVVKESTGLAFAAYPEAMARMPVPWMWNLMFFTMFLFLGITSLIGFGEVMNTCIADSYPGSNKYKWAVCFGTGIGMTLLGLVMCFESGVFWFEFLRSSGNFSLCVHILLTVVVVIYVGRMRNYIRDLRVMFGEPRGTLAKFVGPTGYWLYSNVMVTAPIFGVAVTILSCMREPLKVGSEYSYRKLPDWTNYVCWLIDIVPLSMIPTFFLVNYLKYKNDGKAVSDLFRMHPTHPSFALQQAPAPELLPAADAVPSTAPASSAPVSSAPASSVPASHPPSAKDTPSLGPVKT